MSTRSESVDPAGSVGPPSDAEIAEISGAVRRFVAAKTSDPHDIDDVVQETLARTLQARSRLGVTTSVGYSLTVARHLLAEMYRNADLVRRHSPSLLDLPQEDSPESALLAGEDRNALMSALSALPDGQHAALLAHHVEGTPLTDVAGPRRAPAALAAQLSRSRARLRVDYVLALRSVTLPTSQCRPVLMALSAGDRRRQEAASAGAHLVRCSTCADVAPVLINRDRRRAGVVPWIALGVPHGALVRLVRGHPWASGGAAASTAVAVAAAVVVASASGPSTPPPTPPSTPSPALTPSAVARVVGIPGLRSDSRPVTGQGAGIASLVGQAITARDTPVQAVPANEGFWIGTGTGNRVWVQMSTSKESAVTVRAGKEVSFRGRVVANDPGFVTGLHVPSTDAAQLRNEGAHIVVEATDVTAHR